MIDNTWSKGLCRHPRSQTAHYLERRTVCESDGYRQHNYYCLTECTGE